MKKFKRHYAAIVDYGMGNIFSIENACQYAGLDCIVTSEKEAILRSAAVILPGVGAFGEAVKNLKKLDLTHLIKDIINQGKPFLGICLGMQLLMSESEEFGIHKGLDILKGRVVKFASHKSKKIKIPHIGWNKVFFCKQNNAPGPILNDINNGEFMYFIHSYFIEPSESGDIITTTDYSGIKYCSGLKKGNIYAFQFHPERSGLEGIKIYRNFKDIINQRGTDD